MAQGKRKYVFFVIACLAGYIWLYYNYKTFTSVNNNVNVCLIKHVTNIPCPSCGSTRSILSFLHGDFAGSLYWNPISLLLILILIITPVWVIFDLVSKKETLLSFYNSIEKALRQKSFALPAIALIIANWIWNIMKGL